MAGTRNLGRLVVQLALELAEYKRAWREAEKDTLDGAARVEDASKKAAGAGDQLADSARRQAGALGDAAGKATELAQAAGMTRGAAIALAGGVGVAAAAVGALTVAAIAGAKEQRQLTDSLILTGNYAGLVSGQLDRMAVTLAGNVNGSVGSARQVLSALVSTGRFTTESLGEVAGAVQLVARFSNRTNADVLKDFASMGDGVAKWAAKHNEAYHFLDLQTYQYIKRLEEQGEKQEAMRVTSEALSKHLGGDLTQNLGYVERAWLAVQRAASGAWQAMKEVGKPTTTQEIFAKNSEYLQRAASTYRPEDPRFKLLQEVNRELFRRTEREQSAAASTSALAQATERAIKADDDWSKLKESLASKQERMNHELERARKLAAERRSSASELADVEDRIREKYADKRKGPDVLERQRRLLAELSGVQANYMQELSDLIALRDRGNISEEQYIQLVEQLIARQPMARKLIDEQNKAIEHETKATIEAAKAREQDLRHLRQRVEQQDAEIDKENAVIATMGLSKTALAEMTAARLEDMAATKEAYAIKKLDRDLDFEMYELRKREADQLRERAQNTRAKARKEEELDAAKAAGKAWEDVGETIEHALDDGVRAGLRHGENAWDAFRRSLMASAQSTMLRFGVQFSTQTALSAMGAPQSVVQRFGANPLSAASSTSSLVNMGSSAANALGFTNFAAGMSGVGGSFASTVGAGLATDAMGATVAEGAAAATLGTASSAGAALAAAAPWIAAAIAIGMMLSKRPGGPKIDGRYGSVYSTIGQAENQGMAPQVRDLVRSLDDQYRSITGSMGLPAVSFGAGVSTDPRGSSPSFLEISASREGRPVYSYQSTDAPRDSQALQQTIAEQSTRALFEALRTANLGPRLSPLLEGPNDYDSMLRAIQRVNAGRELENQLLDLQGTAAENLIRARQRDVNAADPQMRALIEEFHAGQDAAAQRQLDIQLQELQSTAAENLIRARQRDLDNALPQLRVTIAQIHAAQDLNERRALEQRMLEAIGDPEALRVALLTRERDAITPVNRATLELVQRQEDLARVYNKTSAAAADFLDDAALRVFRAQQIQMRLAQGGLDVPLQRILNATRDTVLSFFRELQAAGNTRGAEAVLDIAQQFVQMQQPLEEMADRLRDAGRSISDFLRELVSGRAGTATARQALTARSAFYQADLAAARAGGVDALNRLPSSARALYDAQSAYGNAAVAWRDSARTMYQQDLAAARGGNLDAYNRLQGNAQQYIESQQGLTASSAETQTVIDQIVRDLQSLPAVRSYEQQMVDGLQGVIAAINELPENLAPQLASAVAEQFSALDINVDGGISYAEMQQVMAGRATDAQLHEIFNLLDANGDGTISRLEALQGRADLANTTSAGILARLREDSILSFSAAATASSFNAIIGNTWQTAAIASSVQYNTAVAASLLNSIYALFVGSGANVQFRRDGGSFFATGAAFANGVVDRPTAFPIGVMGEAGPEAILPLARVGGELGVRFAGGTGGGDTALLARVDKLERATVRMAAAFERFDTRFHGYATRNLEDGDLIVEGIRELSDETRRARGGAQKRGVLTS